MFSHFRWILQVTWLNLMLLLVVTTATSNIDVSIKNLKSNSFILMWNVTNSTNPNVTYTISLTEVETPLLNNKIITTKNTSVLIDQLEEFVTYNISLFADYGMSDNRTKVHYWKYVTTLPAAPTAKPQNFTATAISSKSIFLSWLPLPFYDRNGIIKEYSLHYNSSEYDQQYFTTNKTNITLNNLQPFTNYQIDIEAVNQVGFGPRHYASATTLKEATGNIVDVSIKNLKSNSFILMWNVTNSTNPNVTYTISLTEVETPLLNNKIITTKNTSVLIDQLEEFVTYNISLFADYGMSDNRTKVYYWKYVTTLPAAPTAKPQNFTATAISSKSIFLSWLPLPFYDRNGIIKEYSLHYNSSEYDQQYFRTNKTNITLNNLQPFTNYQIDIEAVNQVGSGPRHYANATTLQAEANVTCVNESLLVLPLSESMLQLSWKDSVTNRTYFIYDVSKNYTFVSMTNNSSFNISGLQPNTKYSYRVCYSKPDGLWLCFCASNSTREKKKIKCIVENNSLKVLSISKEKIRLTWVSENEFANKTLSIYVNESLVGNTTNSMFIADGLGPNTLYKFQVCLKDGMCLCANGTTLEVDAIDSVFNISFSNITSTSFRLLWNISNPENMNISYVITVTEVESPLLLSKVITAIKPGVLVNQLEEFITYNVSLQASEQMLGNGTIFRRNIKTLPAAPTAKPQNFTATAISSKSIFLSWLPLPFYDRNGIVKEYSLHYNSSKYDQQYFRTNKTNITLDNLQPFTNYQIDIAAVNQVGSGPRHYANATTLHDSPSQPQNLILLNYTEVAVNLTWSPPKEINGHLLGYRVKICILPANNCTVLNETKQESFYRNILKPFTKYRVFVAAINSFGEGPSANISFQTKEAAPSIPTNVSIMTTNDTIMANWGKPEQENGQLLGYKINVCMISTMNESNSQCGDNLTVSSSNTSKEISGLKPFTDYIVTIYAFNAAGRSVSVYRRAKTKEYIPGPVENLKVLGFDTISVNLSWSKPNITNGIVYYKIYSKEKDYTMEKVTETQNTFIRLQNLEEFILYEFTIQSFTKTGGNGKSRTITQRTDAALPSGAPINFDAFAKTSTSILLKWEPVDKYLQNGLLRYYLIEYSDGKENSTRETNKTELLLDGLRKYTKYSFKIYFVNTVGRNNSVFAYSFNTTLEDVPGKLASFNCYPVSPQEMLLTWQPPNEPNGKLLGYNLTRLPHDYLEIEDKENLRYRDIELKPFTTYNYSLMAKTSIGFGEPLFVSCTTNETVPNQPVGLKVQSKDAYWIFVTWKEPEGKLGQILDYLVTVRSKSGLVFQNVTDTTSFNITENITPYTRYDIMVSGRTSVGNGDEAKVTETTEQSVPSNIEQIEAYTTATTVELTWTEPKFPNGRLRYKLFKLEGNREKKIEDSFTETQFKFINLNEFTNYTFAVVPFTDRGLGTRKSIQVKTDSAEPSGKVNKLTAKPENSTAITLSWEPLAREDENGLIDYYRIEYKERNSSEKIDFSVKGQEKHFSVTIQSLRKFTNYTFFVQAHNIKGFGPNETVTERTDADAPGKPRLSSKYTNISATEIKIFWQPPFELNGILHSYFLKYESENGTEGMKRPGSHTTETTLGNLNPYTLYKVSLSAKNYDTKFGPEDIKYYHTNSSEPEGPPRNFRLSKKNESSITLSWGKVLKENGIILSYTINVFKKVGKMYTIIKSETSYSRVYTVTNLKPYTLYWFNCGANGEYGFISPFTDEIDIQTDSSSPPTPPTGLTPPIVPKSYKEITVPLWIASDTNGKVMYYYVVVMETIDADGHTLQPKRNPDDFANEDLVTYDQYKSIKDKLSKAYVAAVISRDEINNLGEKFKVGDGSTSQLKFFKRMKREITSNSEFLNGPLSAEKTYYVFQRAFVTKDKYVSSQNWMGPFETIARPVVDEDGNGGAIAGGIIAAIVVIGIVVAAWYFFRYRRIPSSKSSGKSSRSSSGIDNTTFISDDRGHLPASSPIRVEDFPNYVRNLSKDGKYLFSEEFKLIQTGRGAVNCTYEHSNHPINRENNRYNNIVAYDHTRVLLQPIAGVPESDYINSNYIDGFNRQAAYIATQGPLENTCEAFWRMCWEQSANTIVMLTRLEENGRIKCYQYWPEVGSMCYGVMQVTLTESHYFPSYIKRTFSLIHAEYPGSERFVSQFALLTWNDHSTANSQECLTFIRRVNQGTPSSGGPVVVHCSAGVGRTGTYITLDVNLKRIEREGKIEIYNYLQHIRSQRNYMVQTEAQYVFIHDTLLEFLTFGVTEVQVRNLRDYIKKLQQPTEPGGAELNVDKEFHKLNLFDQSTSKTMHAANASCNKNKNRFLNVLPYDDTRVPLRQIPGLQGSDYINANYIHGYSHAKQFIATQAPLPQTIPSFWRMIWENQCTTLVCLAQETEGGKVKIHRYWPSIEASIHGPLMVELSREETCGDYVVRELKVTHTTEGHSRTIKLFQYVSWPDNSYPESAAGLVDLIGRVQKWHQQNSIGQIVVHCSAGVGRTGVFIALCNMIERVRVEGVVDVFQTVRELRQQRPAMVQTKAQYMFCYLALQDFLASFDIYQNFF